MGVLSHFEARRTLSSRAKSFTESATPWRCEIPILYPPRTVVLDGEPRSRRHVSGVVPVLLSPDRTGAPARKMGWIRRGIGPPSGSDDGISPPDQRSEGKVPESGGPGRRCAGRAGARRGCGAPPPSAERHASPGAPPLAIYQACLLPRWRNRSRRGESTRRPHRSRRSSYGPAPERILPRSYCPTYRRRAP